MKHPAMLFAGAILVAAGAVEAQTCASPLVLQLNGGTISGNTCDSTNTFTQFCGGTDSVEPDVIVQFTVPQPTTATTLTLTPTGTTWDPIMGLINGGCDPNNPCLSDASVASPGVVEVLAAPQSGGPYYLHITTSPLGTPPCGAYTLTSNGTPVTLQQFSVE